MLNTKLCSLLLETLFCSLAKPTPHHQLQPLPRLQQTKATMSSTYDVQTYLLDRANIIDTVTKIVRLAKHTILPGRYAKLTWAPGLV
jgi:hypothetical protein